MSHVTVRIELDLSEPGRVLRLSIDLPSHEPVREVLEDLGLDLGDEGSPLPEEVEEDLRASLLRAIRNGCRTSKEIIQAVGLDLSPTRIRDALTELRKLELVAFVWNEKGKSHEGNGWRLAQRG